MATATLTAPTHAAPAGGANQEGFFKRLFAALAEARMRQVEFEMKRYRHLIPQNEVKAAGYAATAKNDQALPFVR